MYALMLLIIVLAAGVNTLLNSIDKRLQMRRQR
jgi:hypothetical protein